MKTVSLTDIYPNPNQPRQSFNKARLNELAQSIKHNGLLSPVIVVKRKTRFMIVAGERRWRACKLVSLKKVPVRIITATAKQVAQLALLENLQREDLNVLEEALGYQQILNKGTTPEELAEILGFPCKTPIIQKLEILKLDDFYHDLLLKGLINYHQALQLAALPASFRQKFLRMIKAGKVDDIQKGWMLVNALKSNQSQDSFIPEPTKREKEIYKKYDKMILTIVNLIKKSWDWDTLSLLPVVLDSTLTMNIERIDLITNSLRKIRSALQKGASTKEALA